MHSAKEKLSNMASAAKEKVVMCKAKTEEKAEKATARTEEERRIAHENRKAKEARAKMELHEEKAEHAAETLGARQSHLFGHYPHHQPGHVGTGQPMYNAPVAHHQPAAVAGAGQPVYNAPVAGSTGYGQQPVVGTTAPTAGAHVPGYPLGGHATGHHHNHNHVL